jgi:TRAP-type C4-dicarboxylate transport system permease large subunit
MRYLPGLEIRDLPPRNHPGRFHCSTIVVAATGIGLFLPPIGVGFFIACGIARVPVDRASGAMLPHIYMMCIGLLVVILFPWVTLVVPRLLKLG